MPPRMEIKRMAFPGKIISLLFGTYNIRVIYDTVFLTFRSYSHPACFMVLRHLVSECCSFPLALTTGLGFDYLGWGCLLMKMVGQVFLVCQKCFESMADSVCAEW